MNLADPELPNLVVAHPDPAYCSDLVEVLGGELDLSGQAGSLEDLPRVLGPEVDVLVLPLRFDGESLTPRLPELLARWPQLAVVVLEDSFREPEIRAALAAGARDHAPLDYVPRDLRKVVARVGRRQRERRRALAKEHPAGAGLWTFSCAGGGSGQTTLVLALANELAAAGRKPVVVDLDLYFADAGFYLGLAGPGPDMGALCRSGEHADPGNVRSHLREHPSGIRILLEPRGFAEAAGVDLAVLVEALLALREVTDHLLVDLPAGIRDEYLPLLDAADFLFVCTDGRIGSLKNLDRLVGMLLEVGYAPAKVRPLLLGDAEDAGIFERARRFLRERDVRDFARFPADPKAAALAIREAQPVTRVVPRSAFSQAVRDFLAPMLEATPRPQESPKQGLLQRLLGSWGKTSTR